MEAIKVYWLGIPTIERDGTVINLETRKAVALLARLSLSAPSPLSRENLATLFWPEYDQVHAAANLRRSLYAINRALGPDLIISNREQVSINTSCQFWQDTAEFQRLLLALKSHNHEGTACAECIEKLESATALYRGSFLEGLNLPDAPEFDNWQYLQRDQFEQDLASALEKLTLAYASLEAWEKAIQTARRWVSLDALNEKAQRTLIESLVKAGQLGAAVQQFEAYSRVLNEELGQSIDNEMQDFYRALISTKPADRDFSPVITLQPAPLEPKLQPLIKTKLFIPRLRKDYVPRPHLLEKVEKGATKTLTLISAPAGYGKTTLLAEWIDHLQSHVSPTQWSVAWFSLDAGDNDPIRFLAYLTATLEKVDLQLSSETQEFISSADSKHAKTPLSALLNELQGLKRSVLLVLDDYQFINNPAIHEALTFLLDHAPENLHLVISTRSDPPVPLSRMRARGQLSEIRVEDLRFTTTEATRFLNQVFGLDLSHELVTKLEKRTEGWAAGLQLAAVSMQGREDIPKFIEAFSGNHRFIMDYLAEEALSRQPREIQDYLLKTSVLDRLNDSLCTFVLNGQDNKNSIDPHSPQKASPAPDPAQIRLASLENLGLFIVPQDDERVWYRYHHLFADLLRAHLQSSLPALVPTLHMHASIWFENNGLVDEAISHALTAKDWNTVDRLFDKYVDTYLENGQMATLLRWIDEVPQEVILKYPKMCVAIASVFVEAGLIEKINPLLNSAEKYTQANRTILDTSTASTGSVLTQSQITQINSMIGILRGFKAFCSGDPQTALKFTQKAITEAPDMQPRELVWLYQVEALAYRNIGDVPLALERLESAIELIRQVGVGPDDTWTHYGNLTIVVGKLPEAIKIFEETIRTAEERGVKNHGRISIDEVFLCQILREQNQLDKALLHINRAIAYTQWWPSHNVIAQAYSEYAQILLTLQDLKGSIQNIKIAERERQNRFRNPNVNNFIEETWVRIWLAQGDWKLLDRWTKKQVLAFNDSIVKDSPIDELLETRLILAVRIWIEKTKLDRKKEHYQDCLSILEQLEKSSRSSGRGNSLVIVLLYKAITLFHEEKHTLAFTELDNCFELAEPNDYVRIFLDIGESSRALIYAYLQQQEIDHKYYALKILREFSNSNAAQPQNKVNPDALTSRESEILQLLAEGCSNREIADRLVLSEGTIKFHVHNILGKLDASSRTQAIANAREHNLI